MEHFHFTEAIIMKTTATWMSEKKQFKYGYASNNKNKKKVTYPHNKRPIRRTAIESRSYANAYKILPKRRTILLKTRGLKYDLFDHALKYTEENT